MDTGDQEQIQRALNETKKREIEERFSGKFESMQGDLPPEIEAEWLKNIEEFERQCESAEDVTIRHYVGDPTFPPLARIPPGKIEHALFIVLRHLFQHGIGVEFDHTVPCSEVYRFITEELMDVIVDDVRVEGMTQVFIYEEFHPDELSEAKVCAEMFMESLCRATGVNHEAFLAATGSADEEIRKRTILLDRIAQFQADKASFLMATAQAMTWTLDGDTAVIEAQMKWEALHHETLEHMSGNIRAHLDLVKQGPGEWFVASAAFS